MLLTVDTPESEKYLIYDCCDQIIPYVQSFDTETEEIELLVPVIKAKLDEEGNTGVRLLMQFYEGEDGKISAKPISLKFKLPGAYAKKDGKLV